MIINNLLNSKLELTQIDHPVIAGLLSLKIKYAKSLGVEVSLHSLSTVGSIDIKMLDLIDILGVLLDNSIQVSYFSDNKAIDVTIMRDDEILSIKIYNMFTLDECNVPKKYGTSNKIGLNVVKKIVSKYNNVCYNVIKGNNWYEAEILVICKK